MKHNIDRMKAVAKKNGLLLKANKQCCVMADTAEELTNNISKFKFVKSKIENDSFIIREFLVNARLGIGEEDEFLENISGLFSVRFCIDCYEMSESTVIISDIFHEFTHITLLMDYAFEKILEDGASVDLERLGSDYAVDLINKLSAVDIVYLYYEAVRESEEDEE